MSGIFSSVSFITSLAFQGFGASELWSMHTLYFTHGYDIPLEILLKNS